MLLRRRAGGFEIGDRKRDQAGQQPGISDDFGDVILMLLFLGEDCRGNGLRSVVYAQVA